MTMQQIAEELGLSRLTVSSVINGRARERGVSSATETRVHKYLQEAGYVPSRHARDLRECRSDAIGILYCGLLYSHLTEAFNRLVEWLVQKPEPLEIMVVPHQQRLQGLQELIARGVSRLVWIHAAPPFNEEADVEQLLPYLKRLENVIIYNYFFGTDPREKQFRSLGMRLVGVNRADGYRRLGQFLKDLGHTTVAVPGLASDFTELETGRPPETMRMREAGLTVLGIGPVDVPYERSPLFAGALVRSILKLRKSHAVTAACFGDDEIAAHAMVELLHRGVRIPEDMTVIGFDGMPFSSALTVPLTTLRIPVKAMTDCVVRLLYQARGRKQNCFPLELVQGGSHGPAPLDRCCSKWSDH